MRRTIARVLIGLVMFLSSALPAAHATAAPRAKLTERTRFMMGTYVTIYAGGPEEAAARAIGQALDRMEEVDHKFHILNPQSPIHAFNRGGVPIADEEIIAVVSAALEISGRTDGAFDVTVAPLVELWGFGGESPALPDDEAIKRCLERVGYDRIVMRDGRLEVAADGTEIDLGAIAKGYAVGEGVEVLRENGIESALIDAGGDIYALGRRGSDPWKVGIRSPRDDDLLGYLEVEDVAVMGSGDYERFFVQDGVRYHHILDPKTGYPAGELAGITVTAPDPMTADAWATALFVLGPVKGLQVVEELPGVETIMVTASGDVLTSSGLKEALGVIPRQEGR